MKPEWPRASSGYRHDRRLSGGRRCRRRTTRTRTPTCPMSFNNRHREAAGPPHCKRPSAPSRSNGSWTLAMLWQSAWRVVGGSHRQHQHRRSQRDERHQLRRLHLRVGGPDIRVSKSNRGTAFWSHGCAARSEGHPNEALYQAFGATFTITVETARRHAGRGL